MKRNIINTLTKSVWPFWCNVCHSRVRRFLPIESSYREKMVRFGCRVPLEDCETINLRSHYCPHCRANDRDRLYKLFIDRLAAGGVRLADLSMLEFAPSHRFRLSICHLFKEYRTCDLYEEKADDHADITAMDLYPEGRWDAFICSHVLEHVRDDRRALAELHRILKPDGWGILMVPINLKRTAIDEDPDLDDVGERWRRFGQHDHVRAYSRRGFLERVESAGFEVREYGRRELGGFAYWRHGIHRRSRLYVVHKPQPGLP